MALVKFARRWLVTRKGKAVPLACFCGERLAVFHGNYVKCAKPKCNSTITRIFDPAFRRRLIESGLPAAATALVHDERIRREHFKSI